MKHFAIFHNQSKNKVVRKVLRQNANEAEEILWQYLRGSQLGFKFRRQFDIRSFIVDFYCNELRLAVELDGWTHDSEKIKERDFVKQTSLEKFGCKVIRVTNGQVYGDMEKLLSQIENECKIRVKELNP